MVPKSTA